MARIAGIDLPKNKRGVIGLTYIFGIGRSTSKKILNTNGIDESIKVQEEKERKKRNTPINETQPTSTNQNEDDFNAMVQRHRTKQGG